MHYIKLIILFLIVPAVYPAQELFFEHPTGLQNLPSLETYMMHQDRKGFIWITTDAGVCRYDGNKLSVFTFKDGISENVVFKIYEDDKGRIWFSTLSGYIFYYEHDRFHAVACNENLKKLCGYFPIGNFFIGEKDTLFFTTLNKTGYFKIPPQQNYKDILPFHYTGSGILMLTNKFHPSEWLIVLSDKRSEAEDKFFVYNNKRIRILFDHEDQYGANLNRSFCDEKGNIYVLGGKMLFISSKNDEPKGQYHFDSNINHIYLDKDGDLWVCTVKKGGYFFKNADLSKPPLPFLKTQGLSSIMQDREGTIWLTSLGKGLFQCKNKNILYFSENDDQATNFQKDSNRLTISFSSKRIISIYNNDSVYQHDELKNILVSQYPLNAVFLDKDISYFGFLTQFYQWEPKKTKSPVEFKRRVNVQEILKTGKDSFLFVSPGVLITSYNKKMNLIFTAYPSRFPLKLKNGKILVSSRSNGIYELKDNQVTPYLANLPELKTRINAMIEDEYGNLWLATNDHGLYCFDHQQKLHQYTITNHLSSDKINSLTIDDHKNLWLGSYNGITKIIYTKDLNEMKVVNFNKSQGLPSIQIERIIFFNGKIACLTKDICFYFQENKLERNRVAPLNHIESILINEEKYNTTDTIDLKYNKNNLRVQVAVLTYKNPEQRVIFYKLIGYDNSWQTSTTGDIQYTNLSHGTYTFVCYGLNNDNLKSDRPATFTFTINRPFWLTWWFITFEALLFFILFYFVFRFWKNRIQQKEHDKALINQKIAEFKMTALRSQMNPHFVFNAISSIQHYILKQDTFKSYNYLAKFSLLIRTILDNSKEEYIALSQEISTLQLYIELEQIRFKQPFTFLLNVDTELEMDTYIPTMLIQPYVENSIWHGLMPKKTNCILEVSLQKKEKHIFVTIKDNGVGRNHVVKKSNLHVSKGMSITEQRIKELETTNEKKFNVAILDLTDDKGNPAGTEVRIIIPFDL